MRTDAQIDRVQVKLPNASTLGYGKWKAQTGDWIAWDIPGNSGFGRVAGRVHYAPAICEDKGPIRDWILVIMFSCEMTSVHEMWVNPEWVTRCYNHNDYQIALWRFMQSDDFTRCSPDVLRAWSETGYASITDQIGKVSREHGIRTEVTK